jgi:WhiB family transcriptional regulator, redox-sensing transcriptional regulator
LSESVERFRGVTEMQERSALTQQATEAPSQAVPRDSVHNPAAAPLGYTPSAPENWFVDPVRLGVPGVRQPDHGEQVLDNPLAWQSDSLCAQTDPEAFFPEKGGSTRDAKKICGSCEVRMHCLEYALENDERFGIWGGLSERERRKLRKRA